MSAATGAGWGSGGNALFALLVVFVHAPAGALRSLRLPHAARRSAPFVALLERPG